MTIIFDALCINIVCVLIVKIIVRDMLPPFVPLPGRARDMTSGRAIRRPMSNFTLHGSRGFPTIHVHSFCL